MAANAGGMSGMNGAGAMQPPPPADCDDTEDVGFVLLQLELSSFHFICFCRIRPQTRTRSRWVGVRNHFFQELQLIPIIPLNFFFVSREYVLTKRTKKPNFLPLFTKFLYHQEFPKTNSLWIEFFRSNIDDVYFYLYQFQRCCFWAAQGDCDSNKGWMAANCGQSCGTCGCATKGIYTALFHFSIYLFSIYNEWRE